jgi:hypothetical protein
MTGLRQFCGPTYMAQITLPLGLVFWLHHTGSIHCVNGDGHVGTPTIL